MESRAKQIHHGKSVFWTCVGEAQAGRKPLCKDRGLDALNPSVLHDMAATAVGQQEACSMPEWLRRSR